jgi:HTH-type transcriptional regulator/antitoxin HipB
MTQVLSTTPQLGQILRSARRARKLTQGQAATRLGLSQSRLSALELVPKAISVEQLLALVNLYGLELIIQSKDAAPASEKTDW